MCTQQQQHARPSRQILVAAMRYCGQRARWVVGSICRQGGSGRGQRPLQGDQHGEKKRTDRPRAEKQSIKGSEILVTFWDRLRTDGDLPPSRIERVRGETSLIHGKQPAGEIGASDIERESEREIEQHAVATVAPTPKLFKHRFRNPLHPFSSCFNDLTCIKASQANASSRGSSGSRRRRPSCRSRSPGRRRASWPVNACLYTALRSWYDEAGVYV